MVFVKVHRLTTGAVANGATKEDSWKSPHAYVIKEIQVTPRGNNPLTNVQLYADVDGVPIFLPDIPADILDAMNPRRPELAIAFAKGSSFNYKLTNNCGASETFDISLVLETEVWPPA